MASGGYRPPNKPAGVSGIGKNSARTDGGPADKRVQKAQAPDLDTPGQQYGDRIEQEAAQRVAPLPSRSPGSPRPPMASAPSPSGAGGDSLPPFLFGRPSDRPGEATATGLDMGTGDGSEALMNPEMPPADQMDDRELILQFLADAYGNQDALGMLNEIRQERMMAEQAMIPMGEEPEFPNPEDDADEGFPSAPPGAGAEEEPGFEEEDAEFGDFSGEGEEEPVETAVVPGEEAAVTEETEGAPVEEAPVEEAPTGE